MHTQTHTHTQQTLLHTALMMSGNSSGAGPSEAPHPTSPRPLMECMTSMPGGGPPSLGPGGNATAGGNTTMNFSAGGRRDHTASDGPPSVEELMDMFVCAASPTACQGSDSGTMLIATTQGKPSVLVGLLTAGDVCNGPAVFTRVDAVRQWVLAVIGKHHRDEVIHPNANISVHVKSVSPPAGWMVSITTGAAHDPSAPPSVFSGGCNEEGTEIHDNGSGAMLVEFGVDACLKEPCQPVEFVLSWKAEGCAAVKSHATCAARPNCMWINDGCQESECSLDLGWKEVLHMVKTGDAFTAGMGKKAVRNAYMDMGVWVCLRDWDPEMQAACGVGAGEYACFGYEEKTKQFLPLGPNSVRKLVRDFPPERDSLQMLWEALAM
jgi:hypothetical protein